MATPRRVPVISAGAVAITRRHHTLCFGLLLAAASEAPRAAAQTQVPKAALIVTRGEGAQDCPDSAALAERVRAVAGANVVSAEPSSAAFETWVQVAIARTFNGYSGQISTSGLRHGSRTLEDVGPSCASLADAVAVTLAILLDPYAGAPPPKAASPTICPARPPAPAKPDEPRDWQPPSLFSVAAGAGVTLNVLEHAMPLLTAHAGLHLSPRWSLSLGGGYVLTDATSSPGGEVELSLAYVDLGACGRALGESGELRLNWCLAAMFGSLRGSGRGYESEFSKNSPWVAAGVGPDVVFPITRTFSWIVSGHAVLPLVRNGFDVEANGSRVQAFRPSSVGGLLSLGVRGDL
jgi:hypothetical protein